MIVLFVFFRKISTFVSAMTNLDELYMTRCLQLASNGISDTAPNPMVGCVIVHNDKIIGEGYHKRCGESHAEVNAIGSVKAADIPLLPESTLYVNLEPCSHYGKTPPCAQLIIAKKIRKVVVGMSDPNEQVNGRGIQQLRDAGIEVMVGVLEQQCRDLNRRFIVFQTRKRPYVILKWAQTADGMIDMIRTDVSVPPLRISSDFTKKINHKLRTEEAAILVGTRTAMLDNPHLTVTKWFGRNPERLCIDRNLKLPTNYHLLDDSTSTIIFTEKQKDNFTQTEFVQIDFTRNIVPQILEVLYQRQLTSVIVEGGLQLLQAFIDSGLWDECHIETGVSRLNGDGVKAPNIKMRVTDVQIYDNQKIETGIPL